MGKAVARWVVVLSTLFVIGPVAAWLTGMIRGEDGGHTVTLLANSSSLRGMLLGLAVMAIAGACGGVASRVVSRDMGLTMAGIVVAWGAWRLGTLETTVANTGDASILLRGAVEALIVGVGGAGVAAATVLSAPRGGKVVLRGSADDDKAPVGRAGVVGALVGVPAAGAVAWLVAIEPLKGQCVAAAIGAGIAAGAAAQLVASMWRVRAGVLAPVVAVMGAAVLGPIVARLMHDQVVSDAVAHKLLGAGKPASLDWLAGALIGSPIGLAWSRSMLEREVSAG